ncbi:hypothetical protein NP233_g144 [Leucocoprinus birnbaumii]|uniref:Nephrocystin 3-like N-terminal domain-containing protein n=1 Tax=Leucocoprinus birnbaumii TaxID=56174 RepID=A0AAD5W2Q3_9AGAR|nr:hypothetical protein NP233_g144 [Leucocoprinus birnbaumii]
MVFESSHDNSALGGTFVNKTQIHGKDGIDRLYYHSLPNAAYNSYVVASRAGCHEGTRERYIEDITSWTCETQTYSHHLFWMYGPVGVGKSAVAKSCAIKTAESDRLAASFFFSRDNGVVNPARLFTTIAHQIATKIPEYRELVGTKIEANPALLGKSLAIQLHELIIAPFLDLEAKNVSIPRMAILIDGLDECRGDGAQATIVEIVAKSVKQHHTRFPLIWAFFSRPERHILEAFSKYSDSPLFLGNELPVSHEYDAKIERYLRDSLHLRTPTHNIALIGSQTVWPSGREINILVEMVAGLFIYAATIVRFIMDPNAFSPQQQLKTVLEFFDELKKELTPRSSGTPNVSFELDAFYSLIMKSIPVTHLPVVQQVLLIHRVGSSNAPPSIQIPANILGITLPELELCLSKLSSVLTIEPLVKVVDKDEASSEDDPSWPGSAVISFYHASFMEYLCDKERSTKYCIEDERNYSDIALRALRLSNEIYAMNGKSRDEKLKELPRLLRIFPDESFTSTQCFRFRDRLFAYLCECTLDRWCRKSDLGPEICGELRKISFADPLRPTMAGHQEPFFMGLLPQTPRNFDLDHNSESWNPPQLKTPDYAITMPNVPGVNSDKQSIWNYVKFVMLHGDSRSSKDPKDATKHSEDRRAFFDVEAKPELLSDYALLSHYSNAWIEYYGLINRPIFPPRMQQTALLPFWSVFLLMQGDDDRLSKAALSFIKRQWDRDLFHGNSPRKSPILEKFWESLSAMSALNIRPATRCMDQFRSECSQAIGACFQSERKSRQTSSLLIHFQVMEGLLEEEKDCWNKLGYELPAETSEVSYKRILMEGRWTDMYTNFEDLVCSIHPNFQDEHLPYILRAAHEWLDAHEKLAAIFGTNLENEVLARLPAGALRDGTLFSPEVLDTIASTSCQIIVRRLGDFHSGVAADFRYENSIFYVGTNQVIDRVLQLCPGLRGPFWRSWLAEICDKPDNSLEIWMLNRHKAASEETQSRPLEVTHFPDDALDEMSISDIIFPDFFSDDEEVEQATHDEEAEQKTLKEGTIQKAKKFFCKLFGREDSAGFVLFCSCLSLPCHDPQPSESSETSSFMSGDYY